MKIVNNHIFASGYEHFSAQLKLLHDKYHSQNNLYFPSTLRQTRVTNNTVDLTSYYVTKSLNKASKDNGITFCQR